MRRVLELRIVRWELKFVYALGVWLIGFPIAWVLQAMGAATAIMVVVDGVVTVAGFVLGARIFRGRGEPVEPPRPWWQMTARPTLSRRLGILFAVLSLLMLANVILTATGLAAAMPSFVAAMVVATSGTLEFGVLAFLYLNSAIRLRRAGVVPLEPAFRPKRMRLD